MSTIENKVVDYPETDGQPMGEADWHIHWLMRLRDLLQTHYRGQRVYVGCDMFIYYEEGNPKKVIAPDAFVVFDCEPNYRSTFKTWVEDRVPQVVFEITSPTTVVRDHQSKAEVYAKLGVQEYFLFDPRAECLTPPLRGFANRRGELVEMEGPAFSSSHLNCLVRLNNGTLELFDPISNSAWLTEAEVALEHRDAERLARSAAEAELALLRAELNQLRRAKE